jgi:hypothetical protein
LSWANQNGAALWRLAVLWGVHGDNNGDWQTMGGESVGLLYVIGAQVDSKAPSCSVACPFDSVGAVLVCVGKPGAASVGFDNLPKGISVHLFTLSRQISCDIHSPKLAFGESADCFGESFDVGPSGAYLVPI